MGLKFHKRIPLGNGAYANVGVNGLNSISQKAGKVTLNSKGTTTIRLAPGLSYKTDSSDIDALSAMALSGGNSNSLILLSLLNTEKAKGSKEEDTGDLSADARALVAKALAEFNNK